MPANTTHNDPPASSQDKAFVASGDVSPSDQASSSTSTSFSRSQYPLLAAQSALARGPTGRVGQSNADAAYEPIPLLGVGPDHSSYDHCALEASTLRGGHPPASETPIAATSAPDHSSLVYPSDWDNSFGNFLDLVHAYDPQGVLTQEHEPEEALQEFSVPNTLVPPTSLPEPPSSSAREQFLSAQGTAKPIAAPPPPALRTALKRKAEASEPNSAGSDRSKAGPSDWQPSRTRTVSFGRMSKPSPSPSAEGVTTAEPLDGQIRRSGSTGLNRQKSHDNGPAGGRNAVTSQPSGNQGAGKPPGILRGGKSQVAMPSILPPEKVFPIQIGSELFRLSGASISSDAPSYFSQFFEDQIRQNDDGGNVRTLYIDRDPVTFQDISRHLQGYHVIPRDGSHFVKLFADSQFYSLPRLISQLFESEIFIQIGDRHFQIPRDIFSGPGDSPNFFSLGFAVFFSTPGEVFPGLDRKGLLRPPSILPPAVPNRSAEVFAQLLHLLRGYPLHVRDEDHRAELLRDCRYFHLRGLEQKLIAHHISYNLERQKSEIVLRLEDVRQSGVSFVSDISPSTPSPSGGWVNYARPFIDDTSHELILEMGGECTILDLTAMRADFHGLAKARVSSLFQVVANKMNLPTNAPLGLMMMSGGASAHTASPGHTPLSEDRVKIRIDRDTDVFLDGEPYEMVWGGFGPFDNPDDDPMVDTSTPHTQMSRASSAAGFTAPKSNISESSPTQLQQQPPQFPPSGRRLATPRPGPPPNKKRKRRGSLDDFGEWIVRKGQWRLRVQANPHDAVRGGMEIVFIAVKIDAYSGERARNTRRGFLSD